MSNSASQKVVWLRSVLLTVAFGLATGNAVSADLDRGRALHDTHCRMCHDSVAYKRDKKIADTYETVRAQVVRWETNSSLRWSEEDIDNVTAYVTKTYYKIPCPNC
jgi:mono/diheme cytochrome c family protein